MCHQERQNRKPTSMRERGQKIPQQGLSRARRQNPTLSAWADLDDTKLTSGSPLLYQVMNRETMIRDTARNGIASVDSSATVTMLR